MLQQAVTKNKWQEMVALESVIFQPLGSMRVTRAKSRIRVLLSISEGEFRQQVIALNLDRQLEERALFEYSTQMSSERWLAVQELEALRAIYLGKSILTLWVDRQSGGVCRKKGSRCAAFPSAMTAAKA